MGKSLYCDFAGVLGLVPVGDLEVCGVFPAFGDLEDCGDFPAFLVFSRLSASTDLFLCLCLLSHFSYSCGEYAGLYVLLLGAGIRLPFGSLAIPGGITSLDPDCKDGQAFSGDIWNAPEVFGTAPIFGTLSATLCLNCWNV